MAPAAGMTIDAVLERVHLEKPMVERIREVAPEERTSVEAPRKVQGL